MAGTFGLNEMTVRPWLKREVTASSDALALSRLQRGNGALYRLVESPKSFKNLGD